MITAKNFLLVFSLIIIFLFNVVCKAEESLKQQFVQENGFVPKDGYTPENGFVPDKTTAINIGLAVLIPIYGAAVIDCEKPFKATLVGEIWVVVGSIPDTTVGGVAEIDISKKTGKILRVIHGK